MPPRRGGRGQTNEYTPSEGRGRGRGNRGGDRGRPGHRGQGGRGGRGRGRGGPPRSGPWLEPGIQTSYTLDLFNNLSLNEEDETLVFQGNFEDFASSKPTSQAQQPSNPNPPQPPPTAPAPRGGPSHRGRVGPWRGRSLFPPPLPPAFTSFPTRGPNYRPSRGLGLGFDKSNPRQSSRGSTFPTKTSRISLEVLERDRPLLKPVAFVRGEHQMLLFEEEEEILHVPGEHKDHVDELLPSADLVEKIFHPDDRERNEDEVSDESDSESESPPDPLPSDHDRTSQIPIKATTDMIVESTAKVQVENENDLSSADIMPASGGDVLVPQGITIVSTTETVMQTNVETEIISDPPPSTSSHQLIDENTSKLFIVSADPQVSIDVGDNAPNADVQYNSTSSQTPLGVASDDEVIYEAPNPDRHHPSPKALTANQSQSPGSDPVSLPSIALAPVPTSDLIRRTVMAQAVSGLKMTPRMKRMIKLEKGIARKKDPKTKGRSLFALGLRREAKILESSSREKSGMKAKRRQGSDVEWGTDDDIESESQSEEEVGVQGKGKSSIHLRASKQKNQDELDFDPDELDPDIDIGQLIRFAQGADSLSKGIGTGNTIDDLEDAMRLKEEDEAVVRRGSSADSASDKEEEDLNENEPGLDSTSDESFQTKLKSMRVEGAGKGKGKADKIGGKASGWKVVPDSSEEDEDVEDSDDDFDDFVGKAEEAELFFSEIKNVLTQNQDLLQKQGGNKGKNKSFNEVHNGSFENDYDISYNSTKKDKVKNLPPGLKQRWDSDRAKKAKRKQERELQRKQQEMELYEEAALTSKLSPSGKNKLSKLKKELARNRNIQTIPTSDFAETDETLRVQYTSSTIEVLEITSVGMLENLIRMAFLPDFDINRVVLPPKDKQWRKRAHELCQAFHLKTQSNGAEGNRFMTLFRTSKSGIGVRQSRVQNVLRQSKRFEQSVRDRNKGQRQKGGTRIRTRDGEEVGATAPKIDSSNIGFKILEKMGWTEGERIGVTGGLADPLTAIIKTSKLGLGAVR